MAELHAGCLQPNRLRLGKGSVGCPYVAALACPYGFAELMGQGPQWGERRDLTGTRRFLCRLQQLRQLGDVRRCVETKARGILVSEP